MMNCMTGASAPQGGTAIRAVVTAGKLPAPRRNSAGRIATIEAGGRSLPADCLRSAARRRRGVDVRWVCETESGGTGRRLGREARDTGREQAGSAGRSPQCSMWRRNAFRSSSRAASALENRLRRARAATFRRPGGPRVEKRWMIPDSSNLRSTKDAETPEASYPGVVAAGSGCRWARPRSRPRAQAMPRRMNRPSASGKRASSRSVAPTIGNCRNQDALPRDGYKTGSCRPGCGSVSHSIYQI